MAVGLIQTNPPTTKHSEGWTSHRATSPSSSSTRAAAVGYGLQEIAKINSSMKKNDWSFSPSLDQMVHDPGPCMSYLSPSCWFHLYLEPQCTAQSWVRACSTRPRAQQSLHLQEGLVCHLTMLAVPNPMSLPTMNGSQKKPARLGVRALEEFVSAAEHTLNSKVSAGEWVDKPASAQTIQNEQLNSV